MCLAFIRPIVPRYTFISKLRYKIVTWSGMINSDHFKTFFLVCQTYKLGMKSVYFSHNASI